MEKYHKEFVSISSLPEEPRNDRQKLALLNSLLVVHRNYSGLRKYAQHNYFPTQDHAQCRENDLRHGSFIISRPSSMKSSRNKEEELEMIKFAFGKIVGMFHQGDQNETKNKLFLPYFIQFLLDCYIITQHFMSLFLLPLNKEKWIEIDKFILSLESIQQMSFERASFFYQEKDSLFKKNVTIQKMLCTFYLVFFKLVEYCCGCDLTESDLACVIAMALKNSKKSTDYRTLAKNTFEKVERINRGVKKDSISFKDFFRILINNN